MDSTALITGVTGFVGSALALELLTARPTLKLFCVARGANHEIDRRVRVAIRRAAAAYRPGADVDPLLERVVAIRGDLSAADLGIDAASRATLRAAHPSVWHCAASLADTVRDWPELMETNVCGTVRLVDLALAIGAPVVNYVSTAYVAGARHGLIREELVGEPAGLNNHYELSKALAELELTTRLSDRGVAYRILRPSIVVPHSSRGTATGANGALGWIVKLAMLRDRFGGIDRPLQFVADGESLLDTIPIDSVVSDCAAIDAAGSETFDRVFHLTNREAPTVGWFATRTAATLGVTLEIAEPGVELDPISSAFFAATRFERPYVSGPTKRFVRDDGERHYESERSGRYPLTEQWLGPVLDSALAFIESLRSKAVAS